MLLSSHGAVNNNVSHTLHWAITFQRVKYVKKVFIVRVGFVVLILGWTDNLFLSFSDSFTIVCRNVVLKAAPLNNKRERTLECDLAETGDLQRHLNIKEKEYIIGMLIAACYVHILKLNTGEGSKNVFFELSGLNWCPLTWILLYLGYTKF